MSRRPPRAPAAPAETVRKMEDRRTVTIPPVAMAATPVRLDPRESVRRIGFVLLSTDLTTERDAAALLAAEGVAVHVCRVAFENPTTPVNLRRMAPRLSEAMSLLAPGADLAAVCFSCTSGTIEIGADAVAAAIHSVLPGVPIVTPPQAVADAFSVLGARRMALLTPYLPETTRPMAEHFTEAGIEVVSALCMGLADDRDMAHITRETIIEAAIEADHPEADALLISCTALPALASAAAIEARIGKPVVTSNQACLRQLRAHAGCVAPLAGFGRLLAGSAQDRSFL